MTELTSSTPPAVDRDELQRVLDTFVDSGFVGVELRP
jgi:hypothetical protein